MKKNIKIISKNFEFLVELNDSKTSQEIIKKTADSFPLKHMG